MTAQHQVRVVRWPNRTVRTGDGPAPLLTAYHLRTEAEKGVPVADAAQLPDRYRAEISDPACAFADDVVLLALTEDTVVGCVVVTGPADGHAEIKRLWTDPAFRGRGAASALLGSALAHAADRGADTVRLSVWQWRTAAVALYERLGFHVTESWDARERLVCMERAV
ncbi:GNAT family N-acetyltransferase [Streptomyces scabiei]|uniref:GNAT family N-acetyltransferase n=1 Tax=Streptomyces scabiei TaxID=1930 RepID=UPI0029BB4357|nr:GNAT family N-acetyltransferase [Streptomyces scabiei]MDX3524228.1 GNAT family N-acetyltransferase [Streptomyces scabiei]